MSKKFLSLSFTRGKILKKYKKIKIEKINSDIVISGRIFLTIIIRKKSDLRYSIVLPFTVNIIHILPTSKNKCVLYNYNLLHLKLKLNIFFKKKF